MIATISLILTLISIKTFVSCFRKIPDGCNSGNHWRSGSYCFYHCSCKICWTKQQKVSTLPIGQIWGKGQSKETPKPSHPYSNVFLLDLAIYMTHSELKQFDQMVRWYMQRVGKQNDSVGHDVDYR